MLTEREIEVLRYRKQGKTQKEIAALLGVSQPAVSDFENNARRKITDAQDTIAAAHAVEGGK